MFSLGSKMFEFLLSKQFVVVLGPAGSGKTTLVANYGRWLEEKGIKVGYVNLDPGADRLPYNADFDIRKYVRVSDVMRKYNLGPNGAFIKSADLMLELRHEIYREIVRIESDYILVDTPGQMELFVFRDNGPEIIGTLRKIGFPVAIVVFDPLLARKPSDLVALKLMATVIQLRLDVDSIPILNKADLEVSEEVARTLEDEAVLVEALNKESGVRADLAQSLVEVMGYYRQAARLVKVSALTGKGFDELYDIIHEVYCNCGDLT